MSSRKPFDVLIPFHPDPPPEGATGPSRAQIWEHNRHRWSKVEGARVLVGDDPLIGRGRPFSPARALNRAFMQGRARWVLTYGADELPPTGAQLDDMLARAADPRAHGWAVAFSGTRAVGPASSAGIIAGEDPGAVRIQLRLPTAMGPTVVSRGLFRRTGGYDERFEGWGYEDTAMRRVLHLMAGPSLRPPHRSDCWSLNTVRAVPGRAGANQVLYQELYSPLTERTVGAFIASRGSALLVDDLPPDQAPPSEPRHDQ